MSHTQDQLRILVVGNGGREHAFAWKLSQSPLVNAIYVAPGNGGTGLGGESKIHNANVKGNDYPGLVAFAQKNGVNLVVPGPEAVLVEGIHGYFQEGRFPLPMDKIRTNMLLMFCSWNQVLWTVQGHRPSGRLQGLL